MVHVIKSCTLLLYLIEYVIKKNEYVILMLAECAFNISTVQRFYNFRFIELGIQKKKRKKRKIKKTAKVNQIQC